MQSWRTSALEAATNIVVGYGLAVAVQHLVFPLFGLGVSLSQNVFIAAIFTSVSLVRSFTLRRVFIYLSIRYGS